MLSGKKLIIFDMDGTLFNTLKDLNNSVNFALEKFGYDLVTIAHTRRAIGNGVPTLIARSIPGGLEDPHYQECLSIFKDHYREHYFENTFPYEGILETLTKLKSRGYLLACVTNKFDEGANKLINYFLPNIFDKVHGECDEYRKKPYPDLVELTLKELEVSKTEAVYVGDTEVDYQTAVNSGVDPIMVSYGYRTKEQILEITKNAPIIDAPSELLDLLR